MQTPQKQPFDDFFRVRTAFLNLRCVSEGPSGGLLCRDCHTKIKMVTATIEIHDLNPDACEGSGETFEAGIPYCPKCEKRPVALGCVHV